MISDIFSLLFSDDFVFYVIAAGIIIVILIFAFFYSSIIRFTRLIRKSFYRLLGKKDKLIDLPMSFLALDDMLVIKIQVMMLDGEPVKKEIEQTINKKPDLSSSNSALMFRDVCVIVLKGQDRWSFGTVVTARGGNDACVRQVASWSDEARATLSFADRTSINDQSKKMGSYLVVTLALAARDLDLPVFQGVVDANEIKEALTIAAKVGESELVAAEIVCVPNKPDELLTQDEALSRYPGLYKL